jgi:hypothetical protein
MKGRGAVAPFSGGTPLRAAGHRHSPAQWREGAVKPVSLFQNGAWHRCRLLFSSVGVLENLEKVITYSHLF